MTFEQACKIAYKYFKDEAEKFTLTSAEDIGDKWLFEGGEPGIVLYGMLPITVDKKNGKIELFILPDKDNFKILEKAKQIEIPKEYQI